MTSPPRFQCILCPNKSYKNQSGIDKHKREKHNLTEQIQPIIIQKNSIDIVDYKQKFKSLKEKFKLLERENIILSTKLEMYTNNPIIPYHNQHTNQLSIEEINEPELKAQLQPKTQKFKIKLQQIPTDMNFYSDYFEKNINFFVIHESIQTLACIIYSLFIDKYIRLVDKKRNIFEYLDTDNNSVKTDLTGLNFLVTIVFEPLIAVINNFIDKIICKSNIDDELYLKYLQNVIKIRNNPDIITTCFKSITNFRSSTTTKNVESFKKIC